MDPAWGIREMEPFAAGSAGTDPSQAFSPVVASPATTRVVRRDLWAIRDMPMRRPSSRCSARRPGGIPRLTVRLEGTGVPLGESGRHGGDFAGRLARS